MQGSTGSGLDTVDRQELVDDRGVRYNDFKRGLRPRFAVVWFELLLGHVAIVGAACAISFAERLAPSWWLAWGLVGAVPIGVAVFYVQLFLHEAAHFNLAKTKRANDLLANVFVGALVGEDVRSYRLIHFDHHRFLGTTRDTERTYFDHLNARFIIESLTGIKLLKVLLRRERLTKTADDANPSEKKKTLLNALLVAALFIHGGVLAFCGTQRLWSLLIAWLVGLGTILPTSVAFRQLLEHRSFDAREDVDYRAVPHGPVNRSFGTSFLSRVLGGAGFNRHILHHWEPQISCSQLGALEDYLLRTPIRAAIGDVRTTYPAAFKRLLKRRTQRQTIAGGSLS